VWWWKKSRYPQTTGTSYTRIGGCSAGISRLIPTCLGLFPLTEYYSFYQPSTVHSTSRTGVTCAVGCKRGPWAGWQSTMPSMILLAPQLERRTVSFCRNKYSTTHEVKIQAPLRPPLLAEVTISCIVTLVSAGRVRLYFPLHGSVSGSVWCCLFSCNMFKFKPSTPTTRQQYFSLRTNQHQPSATSQTNRLLGSIYIIKLLPLDHENTSS
jgi:hypothetical protein